MRMDERYNIGDRVNVLFKNGGPGTVVENYDGVVVKLDSGKKTNLGMLSSLEPLITSLILEDLLGVFR